MPCIYEEVALFPGLCGFVSCCNKIDHRRPGLSYPVVLYKALTLLVNILCICTAVLTTP